MAKILIAWELGANFGHLGRQLPIAHRLRAAGHQVLFAVRDSVTAAAILTPCGFSYVQAPFCNERVRLLRPPMNYSELLLAEGFGNVASVQGRVRAWRALFELFGAQVVIVDHAPTALLAARSAQLAAVHVGNGFEIPPLTQPLPKIRPWQSISDTQLLRSDELVCRRMNECLRAFQGAHPLASVADLFSGSAQVLATFAELDPYGERGTASYSGPLFGPVARARAAWQHETPRILAYLRNGTPGLKNALAGLKGSGAEVICVLPGIGAKLGQSLSSGRFRVVPHGIELAPLIGSADMVVHSGSGMAAESLLAGVPVLSIPANIEQYLHAQRIEALGAGISMGRNRRTEDFTTAIESLLEKPVYRERARDFAARHADFSSAHVAEHAVAVVERSLVEGAAHLH